MYQYQVSFGQAIQMAFNRYATFTGRSSRSEYWWWCLFTTLVGCVIGAFQSEWISYCVSLAFLLPNLSIAVRRLHDIGKSGWWLFIGLIPLVGWIILIVWYCQQSQMADNQYGPVPNVTEV